MDGYTKLVLTLIAIALFILNLAAPACSCRALSRQHPHLG